MREFLKRLFGRKEPIRLIAVEPSLPEEATRSGDEKSGSAGIGATALRLTDDVAVSRYFELSRIIENAKADGDFVSAIRSARETYPLMPAVVRQIKKESGSFDIMTSHAVHTASTLMAVMGERQGIRELREALSHTPELHAWLYTADDAEADVILVDSILAAVTDQPAIKQTELKKRVSSDGRRLITLAAWLDKGGRLRRVKQGATYLLYPRDYPLEVDSDPTPISEAATRSNLVALSLLRQTRPRSPAQARVVNLRNLPCVRLPKAPAAWEERQRAQADQDSPFQREAGGAAGKRNCLPRFVVYGEDVTLVTEEALPQNERPDPAFSRMFPSEGSTLWIDPTGKRPGFPLACSVALTTDRTGTTLAKRGLIYDVYRADINADGSGVLFLSRDGVLHGYSDRLEPLIAERVEDVPEYAAQASRFGIDPTQLKNHTRCVAISADCSRYLITVVDEAWCYELTTGVPIWGLRFPAKDGWTEINSSRSERVGLSADIEAGLRLMGLSLPVSPEAIARQYKLLAIRWHPDLNPHDPESTRRFQELGAAMELLTGADLSQLTAQQIERVTYEQLLHVNKFSLPDGRGITLSVTLRVGGALGADWIYAANFAREGHGAFLAGYSGRVLEVDASGAPRCIYDIGAVPRRVVESSSRRYIVTDTRLYVLRGTQLEALVDLFEPGSLVVGDSGFGLLQTKRVQWYTTTGRLLGRVYSRDPIRRMNHGTKGLVIETRTHRAMLQVPSGWW